MKFPLLDSMTPIYSHLLDQENFVALLLPESLSNTGSLEVLYMEVALEQFRVFASYSGSRIDLKHLAFWMASWAPGEEPFAYLTMRC